MIETFIELIKSALYKEKAVIPENFDWDSARRVIAAHELYELTYYGLVNSGIPVPDWLRQKFFERITVLMALWQKGEEVISALKELDVEYLPLKGIVIKDMYPEPYMRHMSDIDILIREKDYKSKIKPAMLKLGYVEGDESDHEYVWTKDGQIIELHKRIIPSYNKDFYGVIGDGWEWIKSDNQYAYLVAHFAKHYRDSGIGINHFVDLEICRNMSGGKGLKDLHLTEFCDNLNRTLDCWFRGKEYDEITRHITERIFGSGEYGNRIIAEKSSSLKQLNAAGGSVGKARIKRLLRAAFPSFSAMKKRYKILKYLPFLLPLLWVWRIICSPFRGNVKKNYENAKSIKKDDYRDELKFVGLDYRF